MEAEESIEINDFVLGDGDAGTHGVVVFFAIGNNEVEAVGCAALKDDDQALTGRGRSFGKHRADEEAGNCRCAGHRERAVT